MGTDSISGDKKLPVSEFLPLTGTDATSEVGYVETGEAVKEKVKDKIVVSDEKPSTKVTCECGKPSLPKPDVKKIEKYLNTCVKFQKENPWFTPSFLVQFTSVIYELLLLQKNVRFNEAQVEMKVRKELFELAKSNAELQQLITNTQAFEKLVQAVASFVNAGLSAVNLIETTKNLGEARESIEKDITDAKEALTVAKAKELEAEKKSKVKVEELPATATPKEREDRLEKLGAAIKADDVKDYEYKSPEVKRAQAKLDDLETGRERIISQREQVRTQISQMRGQMLKQVIDAISGVLTANITWKRGELELWKGMQEGSIQSLNKFSETSSKARDDAKSMYDRFADFLAKIVDSVFKAHSITGRA